MVGPLLFSFTWTMKLNLIVIIVQQLSLLNFPLYSIVKLKCVCEFEIMAAKVRR